MSDHKDSKNQEKRLAKELGGNRVPASGSFWNMKGDVRTDDFLVEAKITERGSYGVRRDIWEKIRREAILDGRTPVLALEIQGRRLAVLDWEDFLAYTRGDLGEGQLPQC